jgi:hypothetical protein
MLEERERLRVISEAIMGLPEAVKPMAQKLMFTTKMTAEEILAAARCAPGGKDPLAENQRLAAIGSSTTAHLLGKEDPGSINFDPVEPNVFVPDMDSDLAKQGAEVAKAFKDAGLLGCNVGPGRMA